MLARFNQGFGGLCAHCDSGVRKLSKKHFTCARYPLWLAVLCLLYLFPGQVHAQRVKAPGGGTTLPNVRYDLQFLKGLGGQSSVSSMNESGQIVGLSYDTQNVRRATRFTESGAVDLNIEMADLLAARSDGPWFAWFATDINDLGQIVGCIKNNSSGKTHPFFYDPGPAPNPGIF